METGAKQEAMREAVDEKPNRSQQENFIIIIFLPGL